MLSITNTQRMVELELLLTSNQLAATAPAELEAVLVSACQHPAKLIHFHSK